MRITARNQWKGVVEEIHPGVVKSEVSVRISQDFVLTSVVNNQAVQNLELKHGDEVYAFVSASDVVLGFEKLRISAQNVLRGVVEKVADSSVNTEVVLNMGAVSLTSMIHKFSDRNLGFTKGERLSAIINANAVLIGKE